MSRAEHGASSQQRPAGAIPRFVTVGPESGLDFTRFDDISPKRRILETNGGGVALIDYDSDGLLDVLFTNGCRLPVSTEDQSTPSQLFRNHGSMTFERGTRAAEFHPEGFTTGCAVGDFNSDGFDDLYVTQYGANSLWLNNGDGTFLDVSSAVHAEESGWSTSVAFGDLNADGWLDLYVVNYLDESDSSPQLCPNARSPDGFEGCSPALFDGVSDVVLLNDGAGKFIDATEQSGVGAFVGKGLGVVVSDLNQDGHSDIYVANDGEANLLFINQGTDDVAHRDSTGDEVSIPSFSERAFLSGVALNEDGLAQASMGIALGDFDGNLTADLFLTHFMGDVNTLYCNRGELSFADTTRRSGLGASSLRSLGFGACSVDFDNDGDLDLLVANGHVDDRTWLQYPQPYRMKPQAFRNDGTGVFDDVSVWSGPYFEKDWVGRGLAVGDLDRDGRIDAVFSHQLDRSVALRNKTDCSDRSSVVLKLVGTTGNRSGVGAVVTVRFESRELVRELAGGTSFQSSSALELHFAGKLSNDGVVVEIHWPSGAVESRRVFSSGMFVVVENAGLHQLSSGE